MAPATRTPRSGSPSFPTHTAFSRSRRRASSTTAAGASAGETAASKSASRALAAPLSSSQRSRSLGSRPSGGATRPVRVTSLGTCVVCGGAGAEPHSVTTCRDCGGEGRLRQTSFVGNAQLLQIDACPACEGRGATGLAAVRELDGEGTTRAEHAVTLEIPRGAADGSLVKAAGGDVYVLVKVLPARDARLVRYAEAVALALALAVALFAVSRSRRTRSRSEQVPGCLWKHASYAMTRLCRAATPAHAIRMIAADCGPARGGEGPGDR